MVRLRAHSLRLIAPPLPMTTGLKNSVDMNKMRLIIFVFYSLANNRRRFQRWWDDRFLVREGSKR